MIYLQFPENQKEEYVKAGEIKKPDYSIMKKKPTVVDIDSWIKNPDCELIKVVSQGEADAYTRTLEEAMLCKLLGITVESKKSSD